MLQYKAGKVLSGQGRRKDIVRDEGVALQCSGHFSFYLRKGVFHSAPCFASIGAGGAGGVGRPTSGVCLGSPVDAPL